MRPHAFLIACALAGLVFGAAEVKGEKQIPLLNPYTRDKGDVSDADEVFKDWRVNVEYPIDDRLLEILTDIWRELEHKATGPMVVWSGYRTPSTNTLVGGAEHSFHMEGKAADISIPGVSVTELYEVAKRVNPNGGIGYYPRQGFVHVDVGPRRRW